MTRSSKVQQSPTKMRPKTMMTTRSGNGRSSSDVQERAEKRVDNAKQTNV